MRWRIAAGATGGALAAIAGWDLVQRRHSILRNYPILGHLRFVLEEIGPELRQYIVTDNDQEKPFSRDQRRWVYTSSKFANRYFGFGTDNDLERVHNYLVVKHSAFPVVTPAGQEHPDPAVPLPAAKVLGGARRRVGAFRPSSVVNVSAMSFGSLSGAAVRALNGGVALAGALQTTGEGGVSPHHLHGGDLVWQIGTGYFGCRDAEGRFSLPRLVEQVEAAPQIRAIEIKLSQGAKPGLGGMLPGAKVTPEIAAIRGIPVGVDCRSPARHSAFDDVDGLLDLVEHIASATGLPVGIKSAVGESAFWEQLAGRMAATPSRRGWSTVSTPSSSRCVAPTTWPRSASSCCRWPERAGRCTRRWCRWRRWSCSTWTYRRRASTSCSAIGPAGGCPALPTSLRSNRSWPS